MWMLVITVCLQFNSTEAECSRHVQGPHLTPMGCRSRMAGQAKAIEKVIEGIGGRVLFANVSCKKGKDV